MAHVRHETVDRLRQRVCLACGYRGPEVQVGFPADVFVCPSCGCDLYARPPRSYAEMELVGSPAVRLAADREWVVPPARSGEWRLASLGRWLRGLLGVLFRSGRS